MSIRIWIRRFYFVVDQYMIFIRIWIWRFYFDDDPDMARLIFDADPVLDLDLLF
jgi:hypothetical protein